MPQLLTLSHLVISSRFWRIAGLAGMALTFINAVICGQRLAFGLVPVMFIILAILTGQITNLKRFIPLGLGSREFCLFLGLSFINPDFIQERIDSFVGRWNTSPPHLFIMQQFNFVHGKPARDLRIWLRQSHKCDSGIWPRFSRRNLSSENYCLKWEYLVYWLLWHF